MNVQNEPTVRNFLLAVLAAAAIVCAVDFCCGTQAQATQPECTGDRHYDETGQCCPQLTTTTTIQAAECVCPSCPLPPPCPTVTCKDGGTVEVAACDFPNYYPCNAHTKVKKGDMVFEDGTIGHCARKGAPNRFFASAARLPKPVKGKP